MAELPTGTRLPTGCKTANREQCCHGFLVRSKVASSGRSEDAQLAAKLQIRKPRPQDLARIIHRPVADFVRSRAMAASDRQNCHEFCYTHCAAFHGAGE